MGIDSKSKWIPSPFFSDRNGYNPRWLILHGTAGGINAADIAAWFQNPQAQVSAHYVIGQDGSIIACVDENMMAWANGPITDGHDAWWSADINPNWLTISIEHVKQFTDNSNQLTSEQKAASFALIERLCARWQIPKRAADANGGITGHYSMDPVNRHDCPGPYPWAELYQFLNGDPGMAVPNGWFDDGKTLYGPDKKYPVLDGFRTYILSHVWDANNTPECAAYGQTPVEISNPGLGGGTVQVFKYGILEWTATGGVFPAYSGREFLAYRARIIQLQSQVNQLKAQVADPTPTQIMPTPNTVAMQQALHQVFTLSSQFEGK